MNVINIQNLSRSFKIPVKQDSFLKHLFRRQYTTIHAVKDISFSVNAGELVGFIGPNGAGKSTTIKMMTGILVPTSGNISVLGKVPYHNRKAIAADIGALFGQRSQLWWDLPVSDTFKLLKKIYRIPEKTYRQNIATYGETLGVSEFIDQPVRQLSLGQRMRADLCAALLHDPKILFLDEPTIGLDVVVKKQIREMIRNINKQNGTTIILTTHDMKDIEEICHRIIMIDKGRIIIDRSMKDVKNKFGGNHRLTVVFNKPPEQLNLAGTEHIKWDSKNSVEILYNPAKITSAKIISELMAQYEVIDISIKEPEIDDIIRNLYANQSDNGI